MAQPSWGDFANATLDAIGAPRTPAAQAVLLAWFLGEQPPDRPNATYNPLNIQNADFAGKGYSKSAHGQWNFPDFATGVAAVARELNSPLYSPVKRALVAGDANGAVSAIVASPWAAGHYGGRLPIGQVQGALPLYAAGKIATVPGGDTTPAAGGSGGSGVQLAGISIPGSDILSGASNLFAWGTNPHNWLRLIVGGLGVAALVVGVILVATDLAGTSPTGVASDVVKGATKVGAAVAI